MVYKILKLPEVIAVTGLSRSSIYAFIKTRTFPAPVPLGTRAVGWLESEISEWLSNRTAARNGGVQ